MPKNFQSSGSLLEFTPDEPTLPRRVRFPDLPAFKEKTDPFSQIQQFLANVDGADIDVFADSPDTTTEKVLSQRTILRNSRAHLLRDNKINLMMLHKQFKDEVNEAKLSSLEYHGVNFAMHDDTLMDTLLSMKEGNHRIIPIFDNSWAAHCCCSGGFIGALDIKTIIKMHWVYHHSGNNSFHIDPKAKISRKHLTKLRILTLDSTVGEAIKFLTETRLVLVSKTTKYPRKESDVVGVISQCKLFDYLKENTCLRDILIRVPIDEFKSNMYGKIKASFLNESATAVFLKLAQFELSSMPVLDSDGRFAAHLENENIFTFLIKGNPNPLVRKDRKSVMIGTYLNSINDSSSIANQELYHFKEKGRTVYDAIKLFLHLRCHYIYIVDDKRRPYKVVSCTDVYSMLYKIIQAHY